MSPVLSAARAPAEQREAARARQSSARPPGPAEQRQAAGPGRAAPGRPGPGRAAPGRRAPAPSAQPRPPGPGTAALATREPSRAAAAGHGERHRHDRELRIHLGAGRQHRSCRPPRRRRRRAAGRPDPPGSAARRRPSGRCRSDGTRPGAGRMPAQRRRARRGQSVLRAAGRPGSPLSTSLAPAANSTRPIATMAVRSFAASRSASR